MTTGYGNTEVIGAFDKSSRSLKNEEFARCCDVGGRVAVGSEKEGLFQALRMACENAGRQVGLVHATASCFSSCECERVAIREQVGSMVSQAGCQGRWEREGRASSTEV